MRVEFDKRTSAELNQAIPPTETLNVEAAKEKAGLARQGSLVDRQPPSSLVQKRQILANNGSDIPMMEDDVSKGFLSMKILYCLTFYILYVISKVSQIQKRERIFCTSRKKL